MKVNRAEKRKQIEECIGFASLEPLKNLMLLGDLHLPLLRHSQIFYVKEGDDILGLGSVLNIWDMPSVIFSAREKDAAVLLIETMLFTVKGTFFTISESDGARLFQEFAVLNEHHDENHLILRNEGKLMECFGIV